MSEQEIREKIIAGTNLAVERMIRKKQLTNGYIVVSEGGKVVKKAARDIILHGEKEQTL